MGVGIFRRPPRYAPRRLQRRRWGLTAASVADAIACTDFTAGRVWQRAKGTTARTLTFSGTYAGTAPTSVEVRIVRQSGGGVAQDWSALGSLSVGGGAWSGTLSVPQNDAAADGWYNHLARGKDGGGSVIATSSQTANKWGVGVLVALLGQSNMRNMTTVSSTPPASSDLTRQYTSSWAVVGGNGAIRFANQLTAGAGLLVGVLPFAVGGTTVADWNGDAGGIYSAFTTAVTAVGGDFEFVLWHQGESDAIAGTAKATYKAALDTFYATLRTLTGRNTSQLKFGCALLGTISDGTATDATTDAVRQAQLEWVAATTGAFHAGSSVDMVRTDAYHWTAPYYERMARRYAQAVLHQLGLVAFGAGGPAVASALRYAGSPDVYLTVTHDGGAALEELDGSTDGGSLSGFQASDDDFATTLTVSSTAFSAGEVRLTLSAVPAGGATVKVRYQYGETPSITNPVYDDTSPQSDTVGLPLRPTAGSVTAELTGATLAASGAAAAALVGVALASSGLAASGSAVAAFAGAAASASVLSAGGAAAFAVRHANGGVFTRITLTGAGA